MTPYSSLCDDFYINMRLNTEMELPTGRETILHFFERLSKSYPQMKHFYCRENGDFVLEEDKEQNPSYRWVNIEPRRICSGQINPSDTEESLDQHKLILELAPYHLSVSPLDCEALDLLFGFDFSYHGNHDELVCEALGLTSPLEGFLDAPGSRVIKYEPTIIFSTDDALRTQCRVGIETRTTPYQMRTGEYGGDSISVVLTMRRYGSLSSEDSFENILRQLFEETRELVENNLIAHVLVPLAQAISAK